ncbi:MAG: autotransporter-associated beta strand repeat-containing protein [Chthoniobacter sp.]
MAAPNTAGVLPGMTFLRSIAISGRGGATDGASLLSIGNNTFSGNIYTSSIGETRLGSAIGTALFTGNINITTAVQNLVLAGNGNFKFTGNLGAAANGSASGLDKAGSGGLDLTGLADNNDIGRLQIDGGTVRVSQGSQIGRSTRADAVIPNGGFLEIRSDAGNSFSNVLITANNGSTSLFVDRGVAGTGSLNQTISLNNYITNNNLTSTITGRNGTNVIITALTQGVGANGVGTTWSGNGLLTLGSWTAGSSAASQGLTLTSTGDILVTGTFGYTGSGATPNFNKGGKGMLTLLGSTNTSTATIPLTIADGTLAVANLTNASTSGAGGGINVGTGGTTGALVYLGAGGGALYGGSGAGETDSRVLNVNSTANNVIFANQAGSGASALMLSNLTVTAATSSSLYLGGFNTSNNTITSNIPASTALTVGKIGLGTWVLSGNNAYTGATAVYGGTLVIDASGATGSSTKLSDTGAIIFNSNGSAVAISTAAGTGGWTGDNTAGGNFIYKGSANAGGTQETLGALLPVAGAGNVTIDPSSASGTKLTFSGIGDSTSLTAGASATATLTVASTAGIAVGMTLYGGSAAATVSSITDATHVVVSAAQTLSSGAGVTFTARQAGAVVNFTPNNGSIAFTNASNGTNGIIGGYAILNGTDFAATVAGGGTVTAASYTPLVTTVGSATTNYLSAGSLVTTGALAVNSLKINGGGSVTGTGALTVTATNAGSEGGILFDNSGGAGGISGFTSITTSTANQELVFYTGGSTPTNAFTVASPLANGTGALTKAGSGLMILTGNSSGYTGSLVVDEGTLKASGNTANLLGAPATGSTATLRQAATLDIGGAGTSAVPYGTATGIPTLVIGALVGAGANVPSLAVQTTLSSPSANSNTITVASTAGISLGQTVTGLGGVGIGGYPVVIAISGNNITLSSPQTISSGATINFVNYTTTGALITNSGSPSAIALGTSASTGAVVYNGLISDGAAGTGGTTVIVNGASGRNQTLTGYNTYTGATIISGSAVLRATNLANGGVASSIGASSNAASNLVFNGGTLQYIGTTNATGNIYQTTSTPSVSIDRLFTMAANGTIDSSGSVGNNFLTTAVADNAALVFNNTGPVSFANTTAAARTLTLQGSSVGDNEIDLQLVNNGTTTNSLGITKAGTALWILGNTNNTYTGLTTISGGQLRAQDGTSLPTASPLFLSGGVLEMSGTFSRNLLTTAPTATSANGGVWWSTGGGFAASTSKLTVNLNNGSATPLVWAGTGGNAGFVANGQQLILGSTTALAETEFKNNIDLNGAIRTITTNDNGNTGLDYVILSGNISNGTGTGGLSIQANTPTYLLGANTYNGTTTITSGNVFVTSLGNTLTNPGAATSVGIASGTTALLLGNGTTTGATLTYVGAGETTNRPITLNTTTGGVTLDASGSGALVITSMSNGGAGIKALALNGLNSDFNTISANLADNGGALSITKNSGGTWVLSGNNAGMSGTTTLTGGILGVGSDTALGTGPISWNNGQLMAVGADRSFTNAITINNNNTWAALGNYSLTFNGTFTWGAGANSTTFSNNITGAGKAFTINNGFTITQSASQTITFNGLGNTVINGAITQTNNIGIQYTGIGSLTFGGTGSNTYTGTFTQGAGTVLINRTGAFTSESSYSVSAGYIQNISGAPLTGANALIPVTLTTGTNAGAPGVFNINGNAIYLQGSGANASIEIAGQFNNAGANNRTIYNNLTGGANLILSGAVNLSSDTTNRILTIGGGSGQINFTGLINPSSAAGFTNVGGTLVKLSTGDFNIAPATNVNQATLGNFVIEGGSVTFNQTNANSFSMTKFDVGSLGSLNIDYNTNNVTTTVGANSGAYRTINLLGGTLNFTANSATGTSETLGALQLGFASANLPFSTTGGGTLNFINSGSSNSQLTFGQLNASSQGGTLNIVASSLGTTNKIILPGLLSNAAFGVNTRITVNGTDYATNSANGLVAYTGYNVSNNLDNTQTLSILPQLDNFNFTSSPTFSGKTITGLSRTLNALKIGGNSVNVGSSTSLFQLNVANGGILATGTGDVIGASILNFGTEGIVNVSAGADLTISSTVIGGTGLTKAGNGKLILGGPLYYAGTTAINGGTVQMANGAAIPVLPTATTPTTSNLHVNKGATFDLNGISQIVQTINNNDGLNGGGGTIDNTAAGAVTLYSASAGSTFGGVIQNTGGALTLSKSNNTTFSLSNNNTYTGATNIYGGTFQLVDGGRISGTSAVNINFAGLTFNNAGLNDLSNRINTAAPITMNGGTMTLTGAVSVISQQTVGAVSAASGQNTISANVTANGGSFLTLSSLTRSPGATVNFTGSSLGLLYNNTQSGRVIIGGQATGFIGGWATVGGTEFATYIGALDTSITPNAAQGVTTLQAYATTADSTWQVGDNVKMANNTGSNPAVYTLGGIRTINSLNIQSVTSPITVNNPGTLTVVSGGLLSNGVAGNILAGGILTAGNTNAATELFILDNNGTTITSQITNNGAGGQVSVVKGLGGTTTLSPTVSNTYGGTTTVNSGTLSIGSAAGIVAIPQNLVVSNGAVTFTQAQQIASGKNITINGGGGNVTFVGSALNSNVLGTITFNSNGGVTTPQITGGWIQTSTINVINDNLGVTPTIASVLDLNGGSTTVTTSGLSVDDLIISGIIQSGGTGGTGGGSLIKNGNGSLVLTGANTFGGGVQLNGGTLILNTSASALGTGTLTMADGTALMAGTASVTPTNAVTVNGNISLGGPAVGNSINLGGVIALGGTQRTFTVAAPLTTGAAGATLSGNLTGTQPLIKAGRGALALTGGTINYTPGLVVNAGTLILDQTLNSFSAPVTVAAGTTVNLNPAANGSLGVIPNPGSTPFSISGAGQLTKTGAFTLNIYGNFSYTGPTTIQAGSLLLSPNAVTNAAPTFGGTSGINLGAVGATFGIDNAAATAAISVGDGTSPVNFLARDTVISSTRNADFNSTLNLGGTVTRATGATGVFNFVNNITFQPSFDDSIMTSNQILVGGNPGVIDAGVFVTSGNMGNPILHTDYAYVDASGFVRNVSYGVDSGTYLSDGGTPISATGGNFKFTGSVAPTANFSSNATPNTVHLYGPNANLTLPGGTNYLNGILRSGTGANPASALINNNSPAFTNLIPTIQGGTVDANGNELVVRVDTSNDWLAINSVIANASAVTKVGAGNLVLGGSASNTYTGVTNIFGGGTVYLNKTGGATAIAGNVLIGDATGNNTVQYGLSGASTGLNNQIATSSVVTFNGAGTTIFSLNGSSQTLAGMQTLAGSPVIQNGTATGYYSSTLTINASTDYNLGAGSILRDGATLQYGNLALVKQGTGKLTTGIIGPMSGGISVQGGVLALGATTSPGQVAIGTGATTAGTGFLSVSSGATFDLNGFDFTGDYLTGSGVITNSGTATKTLTLGGLDNTNMVTGAAVNAVWSGTIADGTSGGTIVVQKRGHGTETFNTAQNFSGGLGVQGGTLILDLSTLANPNNLIRSQNALSLGGTLSLVGSPTGTSSQAFNGTTFLTGASNITINVNGGTSTTLALGALGTRVAGSTADLTGFNAGTDTTRIVTTSTTATNGLVGGGWLTYNGVDWAALSGTQLIQYTGYTSGLPATGASSTANYVDTSTGVTVTANESVNTLKLAPATTAQTMTLNSGVTLTLTSLGVLYDNTNAASSITSIGTGTLGASNSEVVVTTNGSGATSTNFLTIGSLISGGTGSLTKSGGGTLVLTANNAFTGATRIEDGTVSVATVGAAAAAQPLGAGSLAIGSGNKTATLSYTGATATYGAAITLVDGGFGQFTTTNNTAATLTLGGIISGAGGLIITNTGLATSSTAGDAIQLSGANTFLGTVTVQTGAHLILNSSSALGASGTLASGTTVQAGAVIEITDNRAIPETFTISGTGVGSSTTGALIYSGATTDMNSTNATFRNIILAGDATIGATGSTIRQFSFVNGFIQGNGHNLILNDTNFAWLVNEVIDNVPSISVNGGLVVQNMTLTGGTLIMTGSGKQIQLRNGNLDRAITYTVSGTITATTAGGAADDLITQPISIGTGLTLTLGSANNNSLVVVANVLGAGTAAITRNGGYVVFEGTGNTGTGTLTTNTAGSVTRIMPVGGTVTNPFQSANAVLFNTVNGAAYPNNVMALILDNSKATGAVSQAFGTLTTGATEANTIQLNNTTGQSLVLTFTSLTRTAGSELLLGITGSNTTASATNKIDITGFTANQGVFWNGNEYAVRDAGGFIRPMNQGTDAGTNLVTSSVASFTNVGGATAHSEIGSGGSVTAQGTATIGTLMFGAGGTSLTLNGGATLTLGTSGILKTGGGTSTISGGTALQLGTASTTDSVIRVDSASDILAINTPITFFNTTGQTLSKFGQGRLQFGANSTFTGGVNINEGTVRVTSLTGPLTTPFGVAANNITLNNLTALELDGTNGNITVPNAFPTLGISGLNTTGWMNQNTGSIRNIAGNNTITGTVTQTGGTRINSDAGTLTVNNLVEGNSILSIGGSGNVTIIAGTGGTGQVTKDGAGTLTFIPTAPLTSLANKLAVQGGTVVLDNSNISTATNLLVSTTVFTSTGGALVIKGKATGATAQTFTTFTQNGGLTRLSGNANGGGGITLNLGAYAVPTDFGTIDFAPSAGMTYQATAGGAAVINNGILGTAAINGFATAGDDWATISGTTISAFSGYTTFTGANGSATTNFILSANQSVATTQAANSLKVDTTGASQLSIAAGQQFNSNAFLVTGSNNFAFAGGGTVGSTTLSNYLQIAGSGTVSLDTPLADNSGTASVTTVIGGAGTGGFTITENGSINMLSNANTDNLYFIGGTAANPRQITVNGAINFNSKGEVDVAHTGGDNVVMTLNAGGAINITAGKFEVAANSSAVGSYIQNGGQFISAGQVEFAATAAVGNAGVATFALHGGTFAVGGTTGSGTWLNLGGNGFFTGTQDGGTLTVNRPGSIALFLALNGLNGANQFGASTYTLSGGSFNINGASVIGDQGGASGAFTMSGANTTANFAQGLVLGVQDFAQGTFTQNGGTVTIGTGQNIGDGSNLKGNNTLNLVLAYNQTTNTGTPAQTKGTYNFNGGNLYLNGIATGQGNGFVGSQAAPNTFTDPATFTTTTGGTANFFWGAGTLAPFDNDMTVGTGVNVRITAAGATLNTSDKGGIGRLVTFNTPITSSGAFGLTVAGKGVVLLQSVNTYGGDTTITGGTVRIGVSNSLPTGGNVFLNSGVTAAGTFDLNGFNQTLNSISGDSANAVLGQVVNNGSTPSTLTVGGSNVSSTFNGLIEDNNNGGTGTLSIVKNGTGTFTLGGVNSYTGKTIVNGGVVSISAASGLGGNPASFVADQLTLNGGQLTTTGTIAFNANRGVTILGTGGTFATAAGTTLAVPGVVALNSGTLTKSGAGTLVLSGANTSASGTNVVVTSGILRLGNAGALPANSNLNISGGSVIELAASDFTRALGTGDNQVQFTGSGGFGALGGTRLVNLGGAGATVTWNAGSFLPTGSTFILSSITSDSTLTFQNGIDLNGALRTIEVDDGAANVDATLAGSLSDSAGGAAILKTGNGTVSISAASTYSGTTEISGGVVRTDAANVLASSSAFTLDNNAGVALNLNGNDQTIGSLAGGGALGGNVTLGSGTLTMGGNNATTIYRGQISGSGGLTKVGAGDFTFTAPQSYTGLTNIANGRFFVNSTLASTNVTVGSSGTLGGSGSLSGLVTVNSGGTIQAGDLDGNGSLGLAGGLNFLSFGTINVGQIAEAQPNILNVGTLTTGNFISSITINVITSSLSGYVNGVPYTLVNYTGGAIQGPVGFSAFQLGTVAGTNSRTVGFLSDTGSSITLTLNADNPKWTGFDANLGQSSSRWAALPFVFDWKLISAGSPTAYLEGDTVLFDDSVVGSRTVSINDGDVHPSSVTFNNSTSVPYVLGVLGDANGIAGTTPFIKSNTGTVTIIDSNSFTGGVRLNGGDIQLGNDLALGTLNGLTFGTNVAAGTKLQLNGHSITLTGLDSDPTTPGGATVENGAVGVDATLTLDLETVGGPLSGSPHSVYAGVLQDGSTGRLFLTLTGDGSLALAGANTYTGLTTISGGTLQIGNGGTSGSLAGTGGITNNGALIFDRSDSYSYTGNITGSGTLKVTGGGTLTLSGSMGATGGTTIDPTNILQIGNGGAGGSIAGAISVGTGSSLIFNTTNPALVVAGNITGNGALQQNNSSGVTILTGTGTYSGGTTITAGTLQIGNGGTAGSITGNVNDNGALVFNRSDSYGFAGNITGGGTLKVTGGGTLTATGSMGAGGGTTIDPTNILQIGNGGAGGSIAGAISIGTGGSLIFNTTNPALVVAGNITGNGSLQQNNSSGTTILTGTDNYTGGTTITAGTLQIGNGGTAGSITGDVNDNGALVFNRSDSVTYGGNVTGSGTVTVATGTLVLTGALNNSGTDTVNSGATLQVGNNNAAGTLGSSITDNGILNFNRSDSLTYGGAITGTGSVSVLTGTVILTSGSSYNGGTTIANGATLQLGNNSTTGSITGDLVDNGSFIISRSNTASFTGNISGPGSVTVNGAGTVTFSGSNNSYTGSTFIQRGTLRVGSTGALSTSSPIVLGSAGNSAVLDLNGFSPTLSAGISTSGSAIAANQTITNNSTSANSVLTLDTTTVSPTYAGKITDGGTRKTGVAVIGGGSLTYTGAAAANTYTLPTQVQNGTLKIGATGAGTAASVVTLGSASVNGVLDLNGFNGSVGGLAVDPSATAANQLVGNSGNTANTLTLTPAAATTAVFAGIIQDKLNSSSGTTGLTLNGANATTSVQVLTGSNTYTGATTITQGILQIGSNGTSGTLGTGGAVSIGSSGTLQFNRTDTYTLASANLVTGAGAVTIASGTVVASLDNQFNTTGALNFGAANASTVLGTLNVGNANFGSLLVRTNSATANTINIASGKTLTVAGNVTLGYDAGGGTGPTQSSLTVAGGAFAITGGNVTVGVNQAAVNAVYWSQGLLDVTGTSSFSANVTNFNVGVGTSTTGAGTVLLSNTANTIVATTMEVGDTAANNGSGVTAIVTLGTGTNVIQADTINVGRGKSTTPGLLNFASQTAGSPGTVTITNKAGSGGAAIDIADLNGTSTAGGAVGTVDLRGHVATVTASTVTIANNNNTSTGTTSGTLSFDAGNFTVTTLNLAPKTAAGVTSATAVLNVGGGNFTVNSGGSFTLGSQASAGTSVATLNLTGGVFTSNASILNGGGSTTSTINLNGGTLDLVGNSIGGANTVVLNAQSGTLKNVAQINTGAAGLVKTTSGLLILEGTNTYTGGTTINAGTVQVGTGGGTGTLGSGNVLNNGILTFNRNNAYAVSGAINGTGALNQIGSGTTTLGGVNTYTGATSVSSGGLTIASGGSLSNTAISVTNAATFSALPGATTMNIGSTATSAAGATLNLAAGTNFSMNDSAIGTVSLLQGATFGGPALTLNGVTLGFDLGSTGADKLAVTKGASISGTNTIAITALGTSLTDGQTYDLITAASGMLGTFQFDNGSISKSIFVGSNAYTLSLINSATKEQVSVAAISSLTWTGQSNGNGITNSNWTTAPTNTNWANGTSATNYLDGVLVSFTDTNTVSSGAISNSTVTVQAAGVAPLGVIFNNSAVNYTVGNASGTVGITGSAGFTKIGTGTVTLNSANSYSSVTSINGGVLSINSASALGNGSATNTIAMSGGTLRSTGASVDLGVTRAVSIGFSGATLDVGGSNSLVVSGAISGVASAALNKTGTGTVTISSTSNTFTGDTNVNGGKVVVSGSLAGNVNVASGTILASGANFSSQVAAINAISDASGGGTVAPGDTGGVADLSTVGQLNATGNVALGTASTLGVAHLSLEIGGNNDGTGGGNNTGPLQYDRLTLAGTLSLTNVNLDISTVNSSNSFAFANPTSGFNGHIYFLITGASSVAGTFANDTGAADPNFPGFTSFVSGGQEFAISYHASFSGNSFTGGNDVAIMAIPEPNALSMLAGSFGLALGLQRFRHRRRNA